MTSVNESVDRIEKYLSTLLARKRNIDTEVIHTFNFDELRASDIKVLVDYVKREVGRPICTAPRDGTPFYSVGTYHIPLRWKQYKDRKGGRWQELNDHGGWENTDHEPTAWKPNE